MNRFAKYSWTILAWNILVILWGTIVRATGSGAGCGNHWPSCNGEIIPTPDRIQTVIEFTHRTMSGIALIGVLILLIWGLKNYPKGHYQRIGFIGSAALILIEAMLGAGLVLFELVGTNSSIFRAVAVSIHLLNTFLLLGFLSMNAWFASGGKPVSLKANNRLIWFFVIGLVGVCFVGMSGAITALGDTLFPSESISHTFSQQAEPGAHFLVQLRIYHPIIAILIGLYSIYFARYLFTHANPGPGKKLILLLVSLILIQWIAGTINVILLAPYWMQVVHLFLADSVWITYVLLTLRTLSSPVREAM